MKVRFNVKREEEKVGKPVRIKKETSMMISYNIFNEYIFLIVQEYARGKSETYVSCSSKVSKPY